MRTKAIILSGVFLLLTGLILPVQKADAHVLVSDKTGKVGAIVHFSPDDDPKAGSPSGIFYDIQTSENLKDAAVHLIIKSESGGIEEAVQLSVEDRSTVLGAFVFPSRGLYYLTLTVGPKVNGPSITPLTFTSSLRITHSLKGAAPAPEVPMWVTFGLIVSVWGLAALIVTAFKRRKLIVKQSR